MSLREGAIARRGEADGNHGPPPLTQSDRFFTLFPK